MFWPLINVVETGRTEEYPALQPRYFSQSSEQVFPAARRAIVSLPRWRIVEADPERGRIRAEAVTRLLRFVDDVEIRIEPRGTGSVVHARSASRVGKGDFGQNARNLRRFFKALDAFMEIGSPR